MRSRFDFEVQGMHECMSAGFFQGSDIIHSPINYDPIISGQSRCIVRPVVK